MRDFDVFVLGIFVSNRRLIARYLINMVLSLEFEINLIDSSKPIGAELISDEEVE